MRIVILALISFCLSTSFLFPRLGERVTLPDSYYLYTPLALMVLALLTQIDALRMLKLLLKGRQLESEVDQLNAEVQSLNEKFHNEKKANSDLKAKVSKQEKACKLSDHSLEAVQSQIKVQQKTYEKALHSSRMKFNEELSELKDQAQNRPEQGVELVQFLSLLQQKAQFLDFVMDDVSLYPNEQVGAAARIVHDGVRKVLKDYVEISPLREEEEGSKVELRDEEKSSSYRLVGNVGEPPYKGTVLHRGWKTTSITLPTILDPEVLSLGGKDKVLAPAEVELH